MIKTYYNNTRLKSPFFLIFLFLGLILIGEIVIIIFWEYVIKIPNFQITSQSLISNGPSFFNFFIIVFLAPFLETLLFQKFLVGVLKKYFSLVFCVSLSVILFGLLHCYSILYIISAAYGGLVLTIAFLFFEKKKKAPIQNTFIIHMLKNAIAFVLTFYF